MKKNIIIVSYAYPPINVVGALRAHAIAKHIDKKKYNVTVITCNPAKDSEDINVQESEFYNDTIKLIKIGNYVGGIVGQAKSKDRRDVNIKSIIKSAIYKPTKIFIYPDKGMFWYYSVINYLRKNKNILKNTDIILSTSPLITTHNIARYIKKVNPKIKWVADFRDFYYLNNLTDGKSLKYIFHKRLEAKFIKEADSLVFVTETMLESYQKCYIEHKDKMQCIYNGFNKDDFLYSGDQPLEGKFSLFYAGSFYNGLRSPLTLLQLLDKAFENKILSKEEVSIKIAGNIDDKMMATIESYESSYCVDYLGFVSRNEALNHMYNSTFLWLIVANIKSHYQTVPAKLFEYIAARRPIINFSPVISESSKIIDKNDLGCNFDTLSFNLDESYVNFESLIKKYRAGDFTQPLSKDVSDLYSWENKILLFEELFQSL